MENIRGKFNLRKPSRINIKTSRIIVNGNPGG
jgi:hypothetical protein